MYESLWSCGLQDDMLPCQSSSSARVCLDSCPLREWCHSTISSSCHPSLLSSIFPSVRSFSKRQLFISGGRTIRASASVIPMNIQVVPVVIREISAFYSLCQQIIACRLRQRVLINHTELINKTIDIRRVFNWWKHCQEGQKCMFLGMLIWLCLSIMFWLQECMFLLNIHWATRSVHLGHWVMSNSLWPHQVLPTRLHCSSPAPRTCSKSCRSSRW